MTVIEVLNLSNKAPGEKGRDLYLEKQREVLGSAVHLIEIDLLRGGEHTTPMSLDRLVRKAGAFDYHVSVHRFDQPPSILSGGFGIIFRRRHHPSFGEPKKRFDESPGNRRLASGD